MDTLKFGVSRTICPMCGFAKKNDEFRVGSKLCDDCRKKNAREQRQAKKQVDEDAAIKKLLDLLRKESVTAPHISEVCAGLIEEFHGLKNFCEKYYHYIERLTSPDQNPSGNGLRAFEGVVKLIQLSTEHQGTIPELKLSDDELAAAITGLFRKQEFSGNN